MDGGQGQGGGGGESASRGEGRMSRRGCVFWLAELLSVGRSQEAHQQHGPALLLESSLKHGEGLLISLKKLDLILSLAGNSKDRDPREGG